MNPARITRLLQKSGYKITRQRQAIIQVLSTQDHPLTAQDIYARVKKILPSISHDTLYRNLELLSSIRVVNRIRARGGDWFELERQHHHHFICLACGEVTCLNSCPIGPEQTAEAERCGFEVIYHNFELSGYCARCRSCPENDGTSTRSRTQKRGKP